MFQLNVVTAIALWLVVTTGGCLGLITSLPRDPAETANLQYGLILSLLFFNNLNILIALCEIALGTHIRLIQEDFQKLQQRYGAPHNHQVSAALAFLTLPVPWNRLFDGKVWSLMWSTYSLYDPSYQNQESFGFFIDVGNGWSTIPPCLLLNVAMTLPQYAPSPLWVGCIGLASYWQILYGTIIYFVSFIFNRRYQGFRIAEIAGFVGVSNGIWFVFPLTGIYACVAILNSKDFSVFGYRSY
jgi:hypothetical protein